MAGKKVWLTWLPEGEGPPQPQETVAALARYGLEVSGAPWVDDLEKVAWAELGGILLDPAKAEIWLVAGRLEDFAEPRLRYGLSLVAAMAREGRGDGFRLVCLGLDGLPENLPSLLGGGLSLNGSDGGWGAKLVAAAYGAAEKPAEDFRFNVIAHSLIGQWFEIGPDGEDWQGAMLGVSGDAKITHHAVGPRGQLPEKTVLEFQAQGIEAELGDDRFVAWSVQNKLGPGDSYYVKVEGRPAKLILGSHPGSDEAEVRVLSLS